MVAEKQQNDRLCIAVVLDLKIYNLAEKNKIKTFSSEWGKKTVLLQAFETSFCVYLLTNQQQLSNGPTISSAEKDGKNVLEHEKFLFWATK